MNEHKEIREALEQANNLPWSIDEFGAVVNSNNELVQWYDDWSVVAEKADAHLIANAPTWLRQLLDENQAQAEAITYWQSQYDELIERFKAQAKEIERLQQVDLTWSKINHDIYEENVRYREALEQVQEAATIVGLNGYAEIASNALIGSQETK